MNLRNLFGSLMAPLSVVSYRLHSLNKCQVCMRLKFSIAIFNNLFISFSAIKPILVDIVCIFRIYTHTCTDTSKCCFIIFLLTVAIENASFIIDKLHRISNDAIIYLCKYVRVCDSAYAWQPDIEEKLFSLSSTQDTHIACAMVLNKRADLRLMNVSRKLIR